VRTGLVAPFAALLAATALASVLPGPTHAAATFVVNKIGDQSDSNLTNSKCDTSPNTGNQCTLRAAIQEANDTPGSDVINFNITSTSETITPLTPLPTITGTVTINGYSQSGASANTKATGNDAVLKIVIDGVNAGADANGLMVDGAGSIIRGLVIQRFDGAGLVVTGYKVDVFGNFIGTSAAGTEARGNTVGVRLQDDQADLGSALPADRNVISGNLGDGVLIENGADYNNVAGNYIGLRKGGAAALANGANGVHVVDGVSAFIGGTAAGAGNVISGNSAAGIMIVKDSGQSLAQIRGNLIGTNAAGTADLGNFGDGIYTDALAVSIGGTVAGARNVISGNDSSGIQLHDSDDNVIEGNLIGTKADGTGSLGNTDGVSLDGTADDNTIGGDTGAAGNVIANNHFDGVLILGGVHNFIKRNVLRNNGFHGLLAGDISVNFSGNVVFGNGEDGVQVSASAAGIRISGNQIYANTALGIDLAGGTENSAKVTSNDAGDPDTGANNLQNFPSLSSALRASNGITTVSGSLNSTASTQFTIELFLAVADSSGHGEAIAFIGTQNITTNASGNQTFSFTVPNLSAGSQLTTTATTTSSGNTSEFSNNIVVVQLP